MPYTVSFMSAVTTYVYTILGKSPRNCELCRETGMYGIPGHNRKQSARKGERIVIWMGGNGYIAEVEIAADPRIPQSRDEAPWPGGLYTYGWVIPFKIALEVKNGVTFPFVGQQQQRTGVSKAGLQRSLALVSAEGAKVITDVLREQMVAESSEGLQTID